MKCQLCGSDTSINYGNGQVISCSECARTNEFKELDGSMTKKKGKKCPACGQVNVPGAFLCGRCGVKIEAIDLSEYIESEFGIEIKGKTAASAKQKTYESNYKTAIAVSGVVEIIGWIVVVIGVIATLAGLVSSSNYGGNVWLLAALPGLGLAIGGLFLVMGAQVTQATVDNADHTREILKHLREKQVDA